MRITLQLNSNRFRRRLDRIRQVLNNLQPFFRSEGSRIVYNEIREAFDSEGYGAWPPLDIDYARRKQRLAPGKPILQFSGAYFRAATRQNALGSRRRVRRNSLEIGVDERRFRGGYPEFLEEGTSRMPARPVFGSAGPRVKSKIVDALCDYVFKRIR